MNTTPTPLPIKPRTIDPAATFATLVAWVENMAVEKNAPGLIVGISGTDSILTYLICAKAYENLGKPERVIGVHYGRPFPPRDKSPEELEKLLAFIEEKSPAYSWVSRIIVPWLQQQAPLSSVFVDDSIDFHDDYQRWADLFKRSLNGANKREPLPEGQNYWVVGTRNATEEAIGSYSNVSGAVSVQPIMHLWKSEVLQICDYLNVPRIAIDKSRQVDCDCGRFDIAADHIEEVDLMLMIRQNLIAPEAANVILPDLRQRLDNFIDEQTSYAAFKKAIPYRPAPGTLSTIKPA